MSDVVIKSMSALDVEIISRFLGLWLMKMEIPEDIFNYVKQNVYKVSDLNSRMLVTMILGSDDTKNTVLRQIAKNII